VRKNIGKLSCLIRPGEDTKKHAVLLHGFGADAADLFPLADVLDPDEQWNFMFPDAPLEVPIGPMWTGRGWFPISLRDLEAGIDFTQVRPPGLSESSAIISELVFNLNAENLVLGGFSQGAMVATNVALGNPTDIKGLMLLSGALLDEQGWKKKAPALKGVKFIQSHGAQDPVIPFSAGQRLFDLLRASGLDGQLVSFSGGHEIPGPVVKKAAEFLKTISA
jgi:phospholipase/carboxylesterase